MSIQGRTQRTTKKDPTKAPRSCPHGALTMDCGNLGRLCDMCKRDAADARTEKLADRLVEGLIAASLVTGAAGFLGRDAEGREHASAYSKGPCNDVVAERAGVLAAALRAERGGGE